MTIQSNDCAALRPIVMKPLKPRSAYGDWAKCGIALLACAIPMVGAGCCRIALATTQRVDSMQTSQRDLWERFPVIYAYGSQPPQSPLIWWVRLWADGDISDGGFQVDDEILRRNFDADKRTPVDAVALVVDDEKTPMSTVSGAVARILLAAKAKLKPDAKLTVYVYSNELTAKTGQPEGGR